MRFDDFDAIMRRYEQSLDQVVDPAMYLAARLDGRGFTKLTKEVCQFEAPFDIRFRDMMIDAVKALMDCGFHVIYGYTQSDEISLLFRPDEDTFCRKTRKFDSVLAGVASAAFSLKVGMPAVFDCRVVPLPDIEKVCDYFRWRQEDALRNALNAYCYWTLRKNGFSIGKATSAMKGQGVAYKKQLLTEYDIVFDEAPAWQKHGVGLVWQEIEREGFNPLTGETVTAKRKALFTDTELPTGKPYADYIAAIIQGA